MSGIVEEGHFKEIQDENTKRSEASQLTDANHQTESRTGPASRSGSLAPSDAVETHPMVSDRVKSDAAGRTNISYRSYSSNESVPQIETRGATPRRWLNRNVTPAVLEGMRWVVRERPDDPVRALGEYLVQWSEDHR